MGLFSNLGSPPHTWRILSKWLPKSVWSWDHLHIRGEYAIFLLKRSVTLGSPPHTWRIPDEKVARVTGQGITSTYVENTTSFRP